MTSFCPIFLPDFKDAHRSKTDFGSDLEKNTKKEGGREWRKNSIQVME